MTVPGRTHLVPLQLAPNPVRRSHYGPGQLIRSFRSLYDSDPAAEDWLSSDVSPRSAEPGSLVGHGQVMTASGDATTYLAEIVAEAPDAVLGERSRSGHQDLGYLAKLLCPDRRIPVHCHPTDAFSRQWLPSASGKTEAWLVLEAEGNEDNAWIGFRRVMSVQEWRDLVVEQDSTRLLDALHPFRLEAGDVAFVPAGVPHAMGPNLLVFEPQQPSDWSILAEYEPFSLNADQATIGLGWDRAISCFELSGMSHSQAEAAFIRRGVLRHLDDPVTPILREECKNFFRVAAIRAPSHYETAQGSCWTGVVVSGSGRIEASGTATHCDRGMSFFVPADANPVTIAGTEPDLTILAVTSSSGPAPWEHDQSRP